MIYFTYFTIYWILNISYAKFHKNTPLKKGALSRNNYLNILTIYSKDPNFNAEKAFLWINLPPDEEPLSNAKTSNFLAELLQRFYEDQDALIMWLRSATMKNIGERERQFRLLQLHREARVGQGEGRFDAASVVVGFTERWEAGLEKR